MVVAGTLSVKMFLWSDFELVPRSWKMYVYQPSCLGGEIGWYARFLHGLVSLGTGTQVGDAGIGAKPQRACESVNMKGFFGELRLQF